MTADLQVLAELSGLLNPGIGQALYDLARHVPDDQSIVEIGSFRGKSTAHLAAGGKDGHGAKVHAVDPWDLEGNVTGRFGFAEEVTRLTFEKQLRSVGLWSRVTPHQGFSVDVAEKWSGKPIGLLFIDGDHSEAAVKADFEAWKPHLGNDPVVAFDDYNTPKNPGVKRFVDRHFDAEILHHHLAVVRL